MRRCLTLVGLVGLGARARVGEMGLGPSERGPSHEEVIATADAARRGAEAIMKHSSRPRRALLALTVNNAQFPVALELAAKVMQGGTRCPAPALSQGGWLCANGYPSVDCRACCANNCTGGGCCTGRMLCESDGDVRCVMPMEERAQEWDIVFFDFSKGNSQSTTHGVLFSDLWSQHVPDGTTISRNAPVMSAKVSHVRDPGLCKLEFALKYLDPEVNDLGTFEWLLLWDGDGVAPEPTWDSCTFLRLMRASGAGMGQPALTRSSQLNSWMLDNGQWLDASGRRGGLYRYRRHAQVGFWAFRADWWTTMHGVLTEYPFMYWYVDMLPMKCLVRVRELNMPGHGATRTKNFGVVVVDATPIGHPHSIRRVGKMLRRGNGARLKVDTAYVQKFERVWFKKLHERWQCKPLYTEEQLHGETDGMLRGSGVDIKGQHIAEVPKALFRTYLGGKVKAAWGGTQGGL